MNNYNQSVFNKVIEDEKIIPFFLSYIKQNLLVRQLPKEIPFDAPEKMKTHFLKTTWDFKESAENIVNKLHQQYDVPHDLADEDSQMNALLDKVCQYLLEKHGENEILDFKDEELLKS